MTNSYSGHYAYNKITILRVAPDNMGIYYCGCLGSDGKLYPLYIGRAKGDGVSIRSRLLDHLRDDYWPSATHFGYHVCSTKQEAENLEIQEIKRCNPKHNSQWTTPFAR